MQKIVIEAAALSPFQDGHSCHCIHRPDLRAPEAIPREDQNFKNSRGWFSCISLSVSIWRPQRQCRVDLGNQGRSLLWDFGVGMPPIERFDSIMEQVFASSEILATEADPHPSIWFPAKVGLGSTDDLCMELHHVDHYPGSLRNVPNGHQERRSYEKASAVMPRSTWRPMAAVPGPSPTTNALLGPAVTFRRAARRTASCTWKIE